MKIKTIIKLTATLSMVSLLSACGGSDSAKVSSPYQAANYYDVTFEFATPDQLDDGWEVRPVTDTNLNHAKLREIIADGLFRASDQSSLLIIKDGRLVFERYGNGGTVDSLNEMRSVSKSIVSLMTGIALDKGYISSLDEPVYQHFPEYDLSRGWDDRKNDIQLKHLLNMNTGLDCDDGRYGSQGRESIMFTMQDWVKFFLGLDQLNRPGVQWAYCAGSVVTLATIIEKTSGMDGYEYLTEYLFGPLGIENSFWTPSPNNHLHPNGLSIAARDLAKIGQLVLSGHWKGQEIVSKEWINSITEEHNPTNSEHNRLWWLSKVNVTGGQTQEILAAGRGGQSLAIYPELNTIIVQTGRDFSGSRTDSTTRLYNALLEVLVKE